MKKWVIPVAVFLLSGIARSQQTPVRLLAIGNSFSNNALRYFKDIVEASGNSVITGRASIGGCDFERHMRHADAFERNPDDPEGRPYASGMSLKDLLTADAWDYVTIQQASPKSFRPETFAPHADRLIAYIRSYAPHAEIVIHQTWAYRDDHRWFTERDKNPEQPENPDVMYKAVRAAYDGLAKAQGLRIIPSGDAMEAARHDPAWGRFVPDASFSPETAVYPDLPKEEKHALHRGYSWQKNKDGSFRLNKDAFHANAQGEYLLGCVWFEFFFKQSAIGNPFVPEGVRTEEAAVLQRIAHRVLKESRQPEPVP